MFFGWVSWYFFGKTPGYTSVRRRVKDRPPSSRPPLPHNLHRHLYLLSSLNHCLSQNAKRTTARIGVVQATHKVKFCAGGREWMKPMIVLSVIQLQLNFLHHCSLTCSTCSISAFAAVTTARPLKYHAPVFITQQSTL